MMNYSFLMQILNNPYMQSAISSTANGILGKVIKSVRDNSVEKQIISALSESFYNLKNEYNLTFDVELVDISVFCNIECNNNDKARVLLSSALNTDVDIIDDNLVKSWINAFYREITNPKYQWAFNYLNLYSLTFIENAVSIMNQDIGKDNYIISLLDIIKKKGKDLFGLNECDNYKTLFMKTILELRNLTQTDYNQIILYTKYNMHTSGLIVYSEDIPSTKQNYRLVIQDGLIYKSFSEETIVVYNYHYDESNYFRAVSQTESEIAIPIICKEKVIGVFNSESERNNHYTKDIVEKVITLSTEFGKQMSRLDFSSSLLPENLPNLHYENGVFQEVKWKEIKKYKRGYWL